MDNEIIKNHQFAINEDDAIWSDFGNELVILCVTSGKYYGLNEVGSAVWRSLKEPKTFDEILEKIKDEFDTDDVDVKSDVTKLITDLKDQGLLTTTP